MISNYSLYGYSSFLIAVTLFSLLVICNELGFRIGRYVQNRADSETKSLTGAVQGSMLGILALLLGFTFSMSMQRYDSRNQALIAEANAISTTLLRAELLPDSQKADALRLINDYIDRRVAIGQIDLTRTTERQPYVMQLNELQGRLWSLAITAAEVDPRSVTSGAFANALTAMFDAQAKRSALLQLHVPELVLLVLFFVFVCTGSMLGYSAGLGGKRVILPTVLVSLLIVLVVFIIIDLDRPKRGVIRVDQSMLADLQAVR